jgi:hypothetical protein
VEGEGVIHDDVVYVDGVYASPCGDHIGLSHCESYPPILDFLITVLLPLNLSHVIVDLGRRA